MAKEEKNIIVFRTGVAGTWREKFNGLGMFARASGWRLHLVDAQSAQPDFTQILEYWEPDGIVIDASSSPKMFEGVDFGGLPVVVMNPESDNMPGATASVLSDSKKIAKLALSELLSANPVALMFVEWYDPAISWSRLKRQECEMVAKMHGIPLTIVSPRGRDAANPVALEKRIADALKAIPKPCGVFAVMDSIGALAISAARSLKARIPEDVGIVSVDDDPEICDNCSPTLTSVRPDFNELGFMAGRLLAEAMGNKPPAGRTVIVPPLEIVRRGSSCHAKIYDRMVYSALEKIRLHACEGITPGEIAKDFDVTRRMAEIRFKAATGKTIGDEIIERRLSAACGYLAKSNTAIDTIANFCGWKSGIAFRKAFKSRFDATPTEWREKNRPRRELEVTS